jgi:hypothetical protein
MGEASALIDADRPKISRQNFGGHVLNFSIGLA